MYRRDESVGRDPARVTRTADFSLPLSVSRKGAARIPPGSTVYTCITSDFFLEEADAWRPEAWSVIRRRPDLSFQIFTKRIIRFASCLPDDWGTGYPNVTLVCTIENQRQCGIRLPILLAAPAAHKKICCEPLLSPIDFAGALAGSGIELIIAGGESGPSARVCSFDWILGIRRQCEDAGIPFTFKQTGYRFEKDGRIYLIPRGKQLEQARRAALDLPG